MTGAVEIRPGRPLPLLVPTERITARRVTASFFTVLQCEPVLGRVLTDADDVRGCASPAVVLERRSFAPSRARGRRRR